jgi:polysaccharide deacetylase 2 family uncharacterized protein YibQ
MRAVTTEVVSAAQKITSNKSQIIVRPQTQPSKRGGTVDDIYISLGTATQETTLRQSLGTIAERYGLAITTTAASAGVTRFDYSSNGVRTHSIHVVIPISARAQLPAHGYSGKSGVAHLAIIIDDMGYDRALADAVIALPFPLTVSVLPHLPISSEVAEEAHSRGDEVLLHLPMESEVESAKPEDIELRVGMSAGKVSSTVTGMLETVPHVVGVNNHQGSRATSDPLLMEALMEVLRSRGLFFIDSRTDAKTVAFDTAKRDGVRAASRKVFLDDTATRQAIIGQLELAGRDATRDGFTIAIGHPRAATIAALAEEVPRLEARGVRLVFASDTVH